MGFSLFFSSSWRPQEAASHPRSSLFVLIPACWPTYSCLCSRVWNVHHSAASLSSLTTF